MAKKEKEVAHLPHWLRNGEADPFAGYLDRERGDLPMAHFSDDALGHYLFMNYDRTIEREEAILISIARGIELDDVPRIVMAQSIMERLRWLSRRVMVLEGTYPGMEKPAHPAFNPPSSVAEENAKKRLDDNRPLFFQTFDLEASCVTINDLRALFSNYGIVGRGNAQLAFGFAEGPYAQAWHHYLNLVVALASAGKYVPFVGDEIVKATPLNILQRSKYHASGQRVNYPAGIVKTPVVEKRFEGGVHEGGVLLDERNVEDRAKEIYSSWMDEPGWKPWQDWSSTTKQNEARQLAARQLSNELKSRAQEKPDA